VRGSRVAWLVVGALTFVVVGAVAAAPNATVRVAPAGLADSTVDFEQFEQGTVITTQYADLGGPGRGVVFGPLPGGGSEGLHPVIAIPPAGQAQSGSHVANIATCSGCEFFRERCSATSMATAAPTRSSTER
jgi:hypothetical protein